MTRSSCCAPVASAVRLRNRKGCNLFSEMDTPSYGAANLEHDLQTPEYYSPDQSFYSGLSDADSYMTAVDSDDEFYDGVSSGEFPSDDCLTLAETIHDQTGVLKSQLTEVHAELQRKNQEVRILQRENGSLKRKVAECDDLKRELQERNEEIAALEDRLDEKDHRILELESQLSEYGQMEPRVGVETLEPFVEELRKNIVVVGKLLKKSREDNW